MKSRRGLIIALIAILIVAAGLYAWQPWRQADEEDGGDTPVTATGNETPLAVSGDTVFADGRLVPARQATLAVETGGLLEEIAVAEGDSVEAGEALLHLDRREAQIGVRQAEAALAQAEADVLAAQARLQSAQEGARIAVLGIDAAEAQLAALTAAPQDERVALAQGAVDAASAGVAQAAGERDVTLETDPAAIAAAEARLQAAEANLFAVRVANEPATQNPDLEEDEREQAQLRLNAAIAAVDAAQAELEALQEGATEAEARAANNAVASAAQQRAAAQADLDLLQVGARPQAVAAAEAEVAQARQAAAEAETQIDGAQAAVRQAQAQVVVAEADLQAAQTALARRTLRAPFAGTVVEIMVKAGQTVAAGTPAVILADFAAWRVESSDLTELDVVKIEEGQMVDISVDAFPGEPLQAQILRIAGAPTPSGDDVTYEVTAVLQEAPGVSLRWGMTVLMTIE
jgi:HlyD family secretion protein